MKPILQTRNLIWGLFCLNLFTGLFFINAGIFHYDSIVLAQALEAFYQKGILLSTVNGRYGLFLIDAILYFPFHQTGQTAEFLICFSSILFHSLSIVALFLLIKELFGDELQAAFGAVLFSFVPYYFLPNTYGKEHGMCMFFTLMSFYLVRRGERTASPALVIAASCLFLIALTIREAALSGLPLFLLFFFYPAIKTRPLRLSFAKGAASVKLWLALFIPLIGGLIAICAIYLGPILTNTLTRQDTNIVSFLGLFSFVLPIAIGHVFFSLSFLFMALALLGIYQIGRHCNIFLALFLLGWFLLLFYLGNTTGYAARHLDIVTVPLCIAASYPLRRIAVKSRLVAATFLAYCVFNMFLLMYPILEFRHHYNGKKEFARYVRSATEPDAVVVTAEEGKFIEYYSGRKTIWFPVESIKNYRPFVWQTAQYLFRGVPVYYTNGGFSRSHETLSYAFMNRFFELTLVGQSLNEDFNNPELTLNLYMQKLYKVNLKKDLISQ